LAVTAKRLPTVCWAYDGHAFANGLPVTAKRLPTLPTVCLRWSSIGRQPTANGLPVAANHANANGLLPMTATDLPTVCL
jgi:hypothetical protein